MLGPFGFVRYRYSMSLRQIRRLKSFGCLVFAFTSGGSRAINTQLRLGNLNWWGRNLGPDIVVIPAGRKADLKKHYSLLVMAKKDLVTRWGTCTEKGASRISIWATQTHRPYYSENTSVSNAPYQCSQQLPRHQTIFQLRFLKSQSPRKAAILGPHKLVAVYHQLLQNPAALRSLFRAETQLPITNSHQINIKHFPCVGTTFQDLRPLYACRDCDDDRSPRDSEEWGGR